MYNLKLHIIFVITININFSAAGITRLDNVALLGGEKISKRSIGNDYYENFQPDRTYELENIDFKDLVQFPENTKRLTREAGPEKEVIETAANTIVFRPLFRRRNSFRRYYRSVNKTENSIKRSVRSTNQQSQVDMQTAANTIVFRPLFRNRHNFRRYSRSINPQQESNNDMETAANTIVFRPFFKRHNRRYRSIGVNSRSIRSAEKQTTNDLETAANSIVFRPLFRHYTKGVRRYRRNADRNPNENEEIMETAHNLVFLPSFRRRRFRRDANEHNAESMETAANTIVFRPLFRRRYFYHNRF